VSRDRSFEAETLPHLRALFGTAFRLTRNTHDAEDLVQETFLRAYRGFDSYKPGTNARAWLFTIMHHVRADTLRQAGRAPQTVLLEGDGPGMAPPQEAMASRGAEIEGALDSLPEPFRTAVVLRDVAELSYDEIRRITDVPLGTVMSRIHRGRALVREALERSGS
jgi:RNA polymerase sigma-70 factor (ECF subfamily)